MHAVVRLIFGDQWNPNATYYLHVKNLSETGRMLLNIVDKHCHDVGMPGRLSAVKNDILHFVQNAYKKLIYFYCPPAMTNSKQYLNYGKYLFYILIYILCVSQKIHISNHI